MSRFLLDGEVIDLRQARLEVLDLSGTGSVILLLPDSESPVEGRPARVRLTFESLRVERVDPGLVGEDDDFHPVECLQHDGNGWLRLTVWGGPEGFPAVVLTAAEIAIAVELLPAGRPPYVLLMTEHSTDGLWDLATADNLIKDPIELEEVDLPDDLRQRIRAWNTAWESGRPMPTGEAETIAEELRRAWPGTRVHVQP